ncbi:MAG: ABC transporter substrate-binding protein [Candidatus Kariarchaeaceae archaeon]|jgi:ABC-type branched-subunit amino acid transport system substrate-binding protein
MKKIYIILTGMLLLMSPFIVNTTVATPGNYESIKPNAVHPLNGTTMLIGLLSPITGGLSAYSNGFVNAALLAIKDLKANATHNGTTNPDFNVDFELKVYDTQTSTTGASAAMTQAAADGVDVGIGAAGSSNTLAAMEVAKTNMIPLISYASTSPELTTADDNGYLWRTPPSDALQGEVISDLAVDQGWADMVIVHLDNSYGAGLATSVRNQFTNASITATTNGTVLATIPYDEKTADYPTLVTTIDSWSPDGIVAIAYATDGSLLFTTMDTQNLDYPVIGADGVADVGIFGETSGTQDAMQSMLGTKASATDAFNTAYKAAYPNAKGDIYTGETYDAVMAGAFAIFAAARTCACAPVGSDVIAELEDLSWAGATGTMGFDANGDSLAGFYTISEVRYDAFVRVGTWTSGGIGLVMDTGFAMKTMGTAWPAPTTTTTGPGTATVTATATETDVTTSVSTESPFPFFGFIISIVGVGYIAFRRKNK